MKHYVGLDVSMKETFICIMNENGKVIDGTVSISLLVKILPLLPDKIYSLEKDLYVKKRQKRIQA